MDATETAKRIGRRAVAATLALELVLGVAAGGAQDASALPKGGLGAKAGCYHNGLLYSDGAIVTMEGAKYQCKDGSWVFFSSGVYAQ